jgi:hypothetical protein
VSMYVWISTVESSLFQTSQIGPFIKMPFQ